MILEHGGKLMETKILSAVSDVYDSSRLGMRPRVCLLDEFPGGTDSGDLGPQLKNCPYICTQT